MAVEDTWHPRELPVLLAIYELERARKPLNTLALAEELGILESDVRDSVRALTSAGYLEPATMAKSRAYGIIASPHLSERGRRTVGQWPEDGYAAFVAAIDAQIEGEPDAEQRSRLERLRDGIVGVGRDVATDVIAAVIKSQIP